MHKPTGQADIAEGHHMSRLSTMWRNMGADEKAPYYKIADARQARLKQGESDDEESEGASAPLETNSRNISETLNRC